MSSRGLEHRLQPSPRGRPSCHLYTLASTAKSTSPVSAVSGPGVRPCSSATRTYFRTVFTSSPSRRAISLLAPPRSQCRRLHAVTVCQSVRRRSVLRRCAAPRLRLIPAGWRAGDSRRHLSRNRVRLVSIGICPFGKSGRLPQRALRVRQEFQCDRAIKSGVFGLIHDTHSVAKPFQDAVMRDGSPDEGVGYRHGGHLRFLPRGKSMNCYMLLLARCIAAEPIQTKMLRKVRLKFVSLVALRQRERVG
jgi:hypothetical protein